jgi:hypothetical protein
MKLRLRNRANRLQKLVSMDGPVELVTNEAMLVLAACAGLDPEGYGRAIAQRDHMLARIAANFCADCDNRLLPRVEQKHPLHERLCAECTAQHISEDGPGPDNCDA